MSRIAKNILMAALAVAVASLPARAQYLQGNITKSGEGSAQPSLSRSDVEKPPCDPFNSNGVRPDEAPLETMQGEPNFAVDNFSPPPPPPPQRRMLAAMATEQQQDQFQGQSLPPRTDNEAPLRGAVAGEQNPNTPETGDPDQSASMKLLWDTWHHRLAETIYFRFSKLSKLGFNNSMPLSCSASYVVTRDGRITNLKLLSKSPNFLYNTMVMEVLQSLNRDPVLSFPPGSRRMMVDKSGTFSNNYGREGHTYLQGDQETVNKGR